MVYFHIKNKQIHNSRSVDSILGGCGTPESGPVGPNSPLKTPFLTHFVTKSGPFGPNPPHETLFLAHFVPKSGPFDRFGVVRRTPAPPPPGYGSE